jgi:hypothetical protein
LDLQKRIRMAAESLLENEALREGLEDEAASALLDWGIACSTSIVSGTAALEDDDEAGEAVYPRMRALRQMLTTLSGLYGGKLDPDQHAQYLQDLAALVPLVYGPQPIPPDMADFDRFLQGQSGSAGQRIIALRALIEKTQTY